MEIPSTTAPKTLGHDRYRVDGVLGQGSVGIVFRVFDTDEERFCAAKVLLPRFAAGRGRARFLNEACTQQQLRHPNIVAVYDQGEVDHTAFLVMEWMGRGSVTALTAQRNGLPLRMALTITADLLHGLAAAHAAGVVHRDVKPSNVLISTGGTAKLADFGLVRLQRSDVTQTGSRLGSLHFTAPEQRYDPRQVTPQSDLFSVAATLCAMLTNCRPPNLQLVELQPDLLDPLDPRIRPIVARAAAYDPGARYESAERMRAEILAVRDMLPA